MYDNRNKKMKSDKLFDIYLLFAFKANQMPK